MTKQQRLQRDRADRAGAIVGLLLAFCPLAASAQVAGDGTLGTQVNGALTTPCTGVCIITEGATRGSNLFHSFRQFSLPNGDFAGFVTTPAIQNVIVRVTGVGSPFISNINGTIATSNPANFFLLNPNGIIFGPGATLNVGGSFLATTANAIQFGNQGVYSATNPEAPPLLTVNPSALWFNQAAAGAIAVQSASSPGPNLQVPNGRSLVLVGGDISMNGGRVSAPGGRVELLGIAGSGTVALNHDGTAISLNAPLGMARSHIRFENGAGVDVRADGGGSITLDGRNIEVLEGSFLFAGIAPGLGTADSQAGDITFRATGAITIGGGSFQSLIFNGLGSGAVGNGGNLSITAKSLLLKDAALIIVSTFGTGDAGRVAIQVDGPVTLRESSAIFNEVLPGGVGETGGITIEADSLALIEGAELIAAIRSEARGKTGDISIQVRDRVIMDGVDSDGFSSGIFNVVNPDAVGNAGNIRVVANSFSITRGARLQANSRGKGDSGDVSVDVRDLFLLDGADANGELTGIFTDLDTDGEGNGGDINVTTGSLLIKNGAQFTANTFAQGNAGNITIAVRDQAVLDGFNRATISGSGNIVPAGSGIFSAVGENLGGGNTVPAIGNGGEIRLSARTLTLSNGAAIGTAVTSGSQGNAGKVTITTTEQITISDVNELGNASGIFTQVNSGAIGNANDIEINTGVLTVTNGAQLRASIAGQGKAGNIIVNAQAVNISSGGQLLTSTSSSSQAGDIVIRSSDSITLTGPGSGLFANTTQGSTGNGGSIFTDSRIMTVRDRARIAVDSQGEGSGGNIDVSTRSLTLNNAAISAETTSTQGGNITLRTGDILLLRNGSRISTTAGTAGAGGDGGNITITTPFIVGVLSENSDITANAFTGRGGNINITTNAIYGLQFQPRLTPFSDITASSEFGINGTVAINTLNIDPNRGLVALPINLTDPSQQISQDCTPGSKTSASSFVATGRGGIPLSLDEPLESRAVVMEWVPLPEEGEGRGRVGEWESERAEEVGKAEEQGFDVSAQPNGSRGSKRPTPHTPHPTPQIIEAQGWIVGADGVVELVAQVPRVSPASLWTAPVSCRTSQGN